MSDAKPTTTIAEELKSRIQEPRLQALIDSQTARGIAQYGGTLDDNDAHIDHRLRHLITELVDAAQYALWIARSRHKRLQSNDVANFNQLADFMLEFAQIALSYTSDTLDLCGPTGPEHYAKPGDVDV
jgi:hypothetical protein